MLSAKQGSIRYHFYLKCLTRGRQDTLSTIEPRTIHSQGKSSTTEPLLQLLRSKCYLVAHRRAPPWAAKSWSVRISPGTWEETRPSPSVLEHVSPALPHSWTSPADHTVNTGGFQRHISYKLMRGVKRNVGNKEERSSLTALRQNGPYKKTHLNTAWNTQYVTDI